MDKLAVDREAFLAAVEEIRTLSMSYHNSLADAGDGIARRFEERSEQIVRDIFAKHFETLRNDRSYEDQKLLRDQYRAMDSLRSQMDAINQRLDALPQSPEGTATETPP